MLRQVIRANVRAGTSSLNFLKSTIPSRSSSFILLAQQHRVFSSLKPENTSQIQTPSSSPTSGLGEEQTERLQEAQRRLSAFIKSTAPKAVDRPKKDDGRWKRGITIKYGSRAVFIIETVSLTFWIGVVFFCLYHVTGGELFTSFWENISTAMGKSAESAQTMRDKLDGQSDSGSVVNAVSDMVKSAMKNKSSGTSAYSREDADQATKELLELVNASKKR